MAARGTAEKQYVMQKILETFEGAFAIDKEIRIPVQADGEIIQIKVTLTAAKENIAGPGGTTASVPTADVSTPVVQAAPPAPAAPSAEELKKVDDFLAKLGIM